jgi:hypothetical protein
MQIVRSHACLQDGASHPEVAVVASLGSYGADTGKGHIHSQLTNKYVANCSAPKADVIRVPAVDPGNHAIVWSDCSIIGLHDWFGWLCNEFHDDFLRLFAVENSLADFWAEVSRTKQSNRTRHCPSNTLSIQKCMSQFVGLSVSMCACV